MKNIRIYICSYEMLTINLLLLHGAGSFLKSWQSPSCSMNCQLFMEHGSRSSLLYLQQPGTGPYPQGTVSCSHTYTFTPY